MAHIISEKLKSRNAELNKLTVESIMQALVQLIRTREYEKISITDICLRAGVSRNAFYHNFKNKDGVLRAVILDFNKDVILRKLGNPFRKKTDISWYVNFFTTLSEYADLFDVLIKSDLSNFYLGYVNQLLTSNPDLDASTRYRRLLWNGAVQNAAFEWLRRGRKETPEEMASICFAYLKRENLC